MQWFEPLIIIAAVALVALPIVLHFVNKKKGKTDCGCGCEGCGACNRCAAKKPAEKKEEKQ